MGSGRAHREVVTLLDHLPSLRHAAPQRIDPDAWPRTASLDEVGRLCIGGVALADVADEFGTPAHVVDEADFRHRLHRRRAGSTQVVPVVAATSLPTTVMGWVDDEGLGMAVRGPIELAAAHAAGVAPARLTLHACGLHHEELTACAEAAPGRIVVASPLDVAYLEGVAQRGQRMVVRVLGSGPDPATVDRVLRSPALELVGLHRRVTDGVDLGIRDVVRSMAEVRRTHGALLTEISLTVAPGDEGRAASVDDAVDESCAAFRFPRPRVVIESYWPSTASAGVNVHRVTSVVAPSCGPRVVVVDGGITEPVRGSMALANRHPLSLDEPMTVCSADGEVAICVPLPCDVHPGDVLAVPSGTATGGPVIAARNNVVYGIVERSLVADELRRDVGFGSAAGGHDQHRRRQHSHGDRLTWREFPCL
jgi:diaminopimelate decarboxylase